jgi:hypothetical protein
MTVLLEAVDLLNERIDTLTITLQKVDAQQLELTGLSQELRQVRADVTPRKEIQDKADAAKRARWRVVVLIVLPLFLMLAAFGASLSEAAHDSCQKRQIASHAVIDVLRTLDTPETMDQVDRGVAALQETLSKPCDEQYRIHL